VTSALGSLLGATRPRVELRPPTAGESFGAEAAELAALAGWPLEGWQASGLELMLSTRPDGKWACRNYAEMLGRQQGKTTGLGGPRALAGLLLLGEELIMWSAHEYKTSIEAFLRVRGAFRRLGEDAGLNQIALDDGRVMVKVNNTNGEEGFELSTGQRLRFIARSKGSGRGFSGDCNIIDEAYAYTRQQQSALAPTAIAKPYAQTVYLSSPPLNGMSGEVLFALRERAEQGDDRLGWRDWGLAVSLDEVAAMSPRERAAFLDDRSHWAATLPALGLGRVTEEAIDQMRRELDDLDFARELLGCWPRQAMARNDVIDPDVWRDRADPESRPGEALVFALDASPGGRSAAIASSGRREDGRLHGKVVDYRPGTGWTVERLVELQERWKPKKILLDPAGPAGALLADLIAAGVEVQLAGSGEMAQACGAFVNDLTEDRLRHCDQQALNDAVEQATTRRSRDAWIWDRKDTSADICPLVAVTLAAHGFRLYGSQEEVIPWATWV
jgi:phage terminase large subunit-like protein